MDLICRLGTKADIPALRQLWETVFKEDDRSYIDTFLEAVTPDRHAVCGYKGEELVGMLFLLPATLSHRDTALPVRYLYAGATDPAFRRQGVYGRLLRYAETIAAAMGEKGIYLHPANDALFSYYEKFGYRPGIDYITQQTDKPHFAPEAPFVALLAEGDNTPDRKNCCVWLATGEGSPLPELLKNGAYTDVLGE